MVNLKLLEKAILDLEKGEKQIRFSRLLAICGDFFGEYRVRGSHHIFKTPWQGDPRINLQKGKGGLAKPYQVRQVLNALRKLKEFEADKSNEQDG
jgi:hypothetical protein